MTPGDAANTIRSRRPRESHTAVVNVGLAGSGAFDEVADVVGAGVGGAGGVAADGGFG
jgi:hypothetical protein